MEYEEPEDWWQEDPDVELEEDEDGQPLPSRSPSRYAPSEAGSEHGGGGPSGAPPRPRSQANSEPPPVFDSAPRPAR